MTAMQAFSDLKPQRIEIGKFYVATVVDNRDKSSVEDKLPLGRIKFRVPELFDGIPDALLPWAMPMNLRFKGGHNNGAFSVPQIGTKVFITFQSHDVYNPFYFGFPYTKDATLDVLTATTKDSDEYPKKHVIYSFDNGNILTLNDDYADPNEKFKFFLKNVGNTQVWCGKNYDMYVKDNLDLVIADKYEVHVSPSLVQIISHTAYSFLTNGHATLVYNKTENKTVKEQSSHTYYDFCSRIFSKGVVVNCSSGSVLISIDTSPFALSSGGSVTVTTSRDIVCKGSNITVEATNWLKLRGLRITKNVEIDFENGQKSQEVMRQIAREEIAKASASSGSGPSGGTYSSGSGGGNSSSTSSVTTTTPSPSGGQKFFPFKTTTAKPKIFYI